jgi:hypothetical protein
MNLTLAMSSSSTFVIATPVNPITSIIVNGVRSLYFVQIAFAATNLLTTPNVLMMHDIMSINILQITVSST